MSLRGGVPTMTIERPTAAHRRGWGRALCHADPLHVPRERYFDRGFFELEKQQLWPRVWQMACRLEEIPGPGDFVEYEICDQSILVVRQDDGSIKAFYNACRHRATELAKGSGRLPKGQIVCPFHGWRWNLDGTLSFVYGQEGFEPDCLARRPAASRGQLETWGGCVWINMDPESRPLLEALPRPPSCSTPRLRQHAGVVVEGDHPPRQLEDGSGGLPRGLARHAHPSAAHDGPR